MRDFLEEYKSFRGEDSRDEWIDPKMVGSQNDENPWLGIIAGITLIEIERDNLRKELAEAKEQDGKAQDEVRLKLISASMEATK